MIWLRKVVDTEGQMILIPSIEELGQAEAIIIKNILGSASDLLSLCF